MVLDFADLKAIMAEVIGPFDHRVLNEIPPFDVRNTTAELIAQYVCEEVSRRLAAGAGGEGRGVRVAQVDVWETDTSCAIFTPESGVLDAVGREPGRD